MNIILQKLTSRKLLISLAVIILAVVAAVSGVIDWDAALALIQTAALFYVGAEASLDLVGIIKGLFAAAWEQKLKETAEAKAKEVGEDIEKKLREKLDAWLKPELSPTPTSSTPAPSGT